jgi:hypothetical protein
MACLITSPEITRLPSVPPHKGLQFDKHVGVRPMYPVSARVAAHGEWASPGIAFDDYARCSTQQRLASGERRLPTPAWALDPHKLRALIVRTMELRAGFNKPQLGTEVERLDRAKAVIARKRVAQDATLTKLCLEFNRLNNDPSTPKLRLKRLRVEIESIDTSLQASSGDDRGAAKLAGIVHFYYAVGMDSVGVGTTLGVKPPCVRATLWRMHRLWAKMQTEATAGWQPRIRSNLLRNCVLKKPCHGCGAAKPSGKGYRYCDSCRIARRLAISREFMRAKRRKIAVPVPPPTAKRLAIVSSPEFLALFASWRARTYFPNRTHCKAGHLICAANALVADLRRELRYTCNPCWQALRRSYYVRITR